MTKTKKRAKKTIKVKAWAKWCRENEALLSVITYGEYGEFSASKFARFEIKKSPFATAHPEKHKIIPAIVEVEI